MGDSVDGEDTIYDVNNVIDKDNDNDSGGAIDYINASDGANMVK